MAKKKLTENQVLVLLHARRGDVDKICDLSKCTSRDGSVGQDIAYLQEAGLLGGHQHHRNTAEDLRSPDMSAEMVSGLLAATKHD